jgi:multiple sugar transport system ATP-binding protein
MVEVAFDHVTKIFGEGEDAVVAVDDVTFTVKDKELIVLLGPSGSGKSTLLRLVAGLEIPTKGDIIIGDKVVTDLTPRERDVAMVFQSYALYPHMSVFDNIAFPLKIRKMPKDEIKSRVEKIAEMLNIKHLLNRSPGQLSGGEMQRVALARAIVRNPQVFLFDEPLSNLDAKLRVTTRGFLKRLQKDLGITSIYVTHDQEEATTIADRIVVLDKGKVQQIDSPEAIYSNPRNLFVAGFIGSPPMNMIEGSLVTEHGKNFFEAGSIKFEIPPTLIRSENVSKTKDITLGIRPGDVRVVPTPSRSVQAFKGKVYITESVGSIKYVMIEVGETMIRAMTEIGFDVGIGDDVYFVFDLKNAYFFDSRSGNRI